MSNQTATASVGEQMRNDPAIASAIETIVERVRAHASQITDIRPANPDLKVSYDDLLERSAAVKGRGLLYPTLSSGAGNGALVEMADGSVKWDMITGIGVHFMGHAHPEVIRAQASAAIEDTTKHGNLQSSFAAYEFGEKLVRLAQRNSRLKHAFMTTSGAMANESALKVCYQKHFPASRVLAFKHCFMGRSVTMAQIGDSHAGREGIPLSTQVDYMPFWNEVAVEKVGGATKFIDHCVWRLQQYIDRYPKMHACFIFELVQGEGGFNLGNRDFFRALMECCRANNIAVWDDEIQSFGRTERMFAYEMYDLGEFVDVFCVGKMTQACATMWTEEYNPKAGLLSGTFTGAGVDFAVGSALLDHLASSDYYGPDGRFAAHHRAFRDQVRGLMDRHPDWFGEALFTKELVGGVGGMMRFTPFGGDKAKIAKLCKVAYDEGVILFYCGHGPYHVRMLPPLPVMKMEDWPRVFAVLERAMAKVASED
ncbi:MAG: aminotransferase class III-fold pyridoxal phosphate-dependent enzyme [Planctomycetota bacterium]|nr:MAG: aminotransferase class III-fold pyridoxal phosphate-dependent enzyme [Planctomycetota bacterium]